MTFQEWLRTDAGRMVSFEKMPRMLEIVWNASAEAAEVAADESAAFARGLQNELQAAESERDEARRQLSEAQHAIDVLSNTVVAQNNEIKRLSQQREDVAEYRAEIERLNQAATA